MLLLILISLLVVVQVLGYNPASPSSSSSGGAGVFIYKDIQALGDTLCQEVLRCYDQSVSSGEGEGFFTLAIPGGSILNMLGGLKGESRIDWSKCFLAYVNHRCVPLDDETSTHFKAQDLFLKSWQDQGLKVFTLGGSTDAVEEAARYTQLLAALPKNDQGFPVFDLSLIGVGLDGHIGSLYPDTPAVLDEKSVVIPVVKPSSSSITLSLPVMLASKEIIIATGGTSKKYPLGKAEGMVRALEAPDETVSTYPAVAFRQSAKWLMDEGASSLLQGSYTRL